MILSLKELLNVSSDWTEHKNNNKSSIAGTLGGHHGSVSTQTGGNGGASSVPSDFQSMQIEKILEALSLATPQQSSGGHKFSFSDPDIKELSYDLGVDPRILKYKLQQHFQHSQALKANQNQYF